MPLRLLRIPEILGKYVPSLTKPECLEWTAYKNPAGYGQIRVDWKGWLVHRFVYTRLFGEIPDGLIIMHTCDNPACINPAHLELGTHMHNVRDKEAKGRGNQGPQNGQAKLTEDDVRQIREAYTGARGELAALGRRFGAHRSCIHKIVNHTHWSKYD